PPLRPRLPWRGPLRACLSRRLGFCPFDGGTLELSGVLGGSPSCAFSAAISRSRASSRSNSARISASFSASVRRLRSGRASTRSLNRVARDRVKHNLASQQRPPPHHCQAQLATWDEQLQSLICHYLRTFSVVALQ